MTDTLALAPSIALLAVEETTPATLYGLLEVFSSVGSVWEELTGDRDSVAPLDVRIVASKTTGVKTTSGAIIVADCGLVDFDVIITTDLNFSVLSSPKGLWREETSWLADQYKRGAIVCSVCTGTIMLAEAGLLDGLTVTTHWAAARMLGTCYPKVVVEPSRILSLDGEGHRIITTGGVASWEDLALYLISRFRGQREAIRTAKVFLFGDRSDGQLPFAGLQQHRNHEDAIVQNLQAWLADNYTVQNPVAQMSARSKLPPRTLVRRFRAATGYSPIDYVQTLRMEEAKQILETTTMPVEEIGMEIGYEDASYFRRLFKRRTGITPARYRQRFAGISAMPKGS